MRIRGICTAIMLCFLMSAFVSAEVIQIAGGNKQLGCVGQKAQELLSVRTIRKTGGIVSNVKVTFNIAQQPSQPLKKGSSGSLSAYEVYTDTNGLASVEFNFGKPKAGDYVITAVTEDTLLDPISFHLIAMQDNWMLMVLFALLGGLGVFLFGMFYLNDSLQKVAGKKFRSLLISLTKNRIKGTMTGLLVTLLNQSSSATTVLEVSLVSAGLLTFYQSIPVTIGAEIGSTVTAQLVAFKLSDYAAIIAGFGFFLSFFSKQKRIKSIGDTILGFGILFLGMKLMSDGLMPLKNYKPFLSLMENVGNPFVGIMVGLIFTMVVQSSGATTGIVIALALAGAITLKEAIPINLGANIGTCITAILGSIGSGREGKRVAVFHTLAQAAGVILVYPFLTLVTYKGVPSWIYFAEWFTRTVFNSTELARQIAMAHTLVAVFNSMWLLLMLKYANKFMLWLMPPLQEEKPFGPIYISESLFDTPEIALVQTRKEIVRESEIALEMFREAITVIKENNIRLCESLCLKDVRLDTLHNAVVPYLTKLGQGTLSDEQSKEQTSLLYITSQIEEIGDIVDKNLMPLARKRIENNLWFSDEGWKDIVSLHARVLDMLEKLVEALKANDKELAQLVADSKVAIGAYESELRKKHIARLNSGLVETLETSSIHLDMIDQFKRINSHVVSVAYIILGEI